MLADNKDYKICDFLEFAFPLGYLADDSILVDVDKKKLWKYKNHLGPVNKLIKIIITQ